MIFARRLTAVAAVLGLSTGLAAASPAISETDLNMRTGPGTEYGVVTVIPGGATVDVAGCGGGWCDVAWAGYSGYASAGYLDAMGGVAIAPPPAVVVRPGVVVRDRRYVRPGRVINRAVRGVGRAIRRDARQDRREVRQDRRQGRRAQQRSQRREVRQDRRQGRRAPQRSERRETRQNRPAERRAERRNR